MRNLYRVESTDLALLTHACSARVSGRIECYYRLAVQRTAIFENLASSPKFVGFVEEKPYLQRRTAPETAFQKMLSGQNGEWESNC